MATTTDVIQFIAIAVPLVGALGWLFQLKGRLDGHDTQHAAHKQAHEELREDIHYIRNRIDRALNGRHD